MARGSGIGQDELRRANLSAVLSRVHASGPTSRAALTAELGLNRSTIGDLTAQLDALGLVSEMRPTHEPWRAAGRRTSSCRAQDVTVVAVALDVDRIVSALVGLGGVVLERRERLHQRGGHDVERRRRVGAPRRSQELVGLPAAERCLGVGVSVPGVVRADDGLVRFAPNLGWVDEPFTEMLQRELDLPLLTGNDANLGVFAEHLRGAAVGVNDVAYLSGSVGIGGGFLVDGQPLRGSGGYAGEIGHLLVDSGGQRRAAAARAGAGRRRSARTTCSRRPGGCPAGARGGGRGDRRGGGGDARAAAALDEVAELDRRRAARDRQHLQPRGDRARAACWPRSGWTGTTWSMRSMSSAGPTALLEQVRVMPAGLGEDSSLIGAAEMAFEPAARRPAQRRPAGGRRHRLAGGLRRRGSTPS